MGVAFVFLPIALLIFWPNGWAINRLIVRIYFSLNVDCLGDLPPLDAPGPLDFSTLLNAIMLAPFAMLAVLALPRLRWLWVAVGGAACAVAIEIIRAAFLPGHEDSVIDAVTDSTGALTGASFGHALNCAFARRTSRSPLRRPLPRRQP